MSSSKPATDAGASPGPSTPVEPDVAAADYVFDDAYGFENRKAETERLQVALQNLVPSGIQLHKFTYDALIHNGFTVNRFIMFSRVLLCHRDQQLQASLLQLGIQQGFFTHPKSMSVKGFVQLCTFLKGRPGQQALQAAKKRLKLLRKAGPSVRADVAALSLVFNDQVSEMAARVKAIRQRYNTRIKAQSNTTRLPEGENDEAIATIRCLISEAHRNKIRRLERKRDEAIAAICDHFKPASCFKEPEPEIFMRRCYEMYVKAAAKAGKQPLPKHYGGDSVARECFANSVRGAFIADFVEQEANRSALIQYIQRKIVVYDHEYKVKRAATYRIYLAAVGEN